MPNQPREGNDARRFRMDLGEWEEFGSDAAFMGTDRSELLRELIRWWMRKPGAKMPPRPPLESA